jgi:hypothetical protein
LQVGRIADHLDGNAVHVDAINRNDRAS